MPDDKLTEFLVQLCANTNDLLTRYLANRAAVVNAADLTTEAKEAFAALPVANMLRSEIASTQVSGGGGSKPAPIKKAPPKSKKRTPRKAAKKPPAKAAKKAPSKAKKAATRGRKR